MPPTTIVFNPKPRPDEVEAFYDETLRTALGGILANHDATSPSFAAERHAREMTERRFNVKIILPIDERPADVPEKS